jgi:hypothetical protein
MAVAQKWQFEFFPGNQRARSNEKNPLGNYARETF